MSEKGYTLWEKWTGKVKEEPGPKQEDLITNPLKLHCGDIVVSKLLEETDKRYSVVEVREYKRRIAGNDFKSADYLLQDKEAKRILRANPRLERDPDDARECDLLWLEIYAEMEFDEGVRKSVQDREFNIDEDDDGKFDITYFAFQSGPEGYLTLVRTAKLGEKNLTDNILRYWDYYRKGDTKQNEPEGEDVFFFIEINENDGYITMLKGMRVSSRDLEIYPAE